MPIEIRNTINKQLLYRNELTEHEFNQPVLSEHSFQVKLPFADMQMAKWQFDGIQILFNNWHYNRPAPVSFENDVEMVNLQFNLKGEMQLLSGNSSRMIAIADNQHNLLYSNGMAGILTGNVDQDYSAFVIQFSREAFLRIAENAGEVLERFAEKVAAQKAAVLSPSYMPIDPRQQQAIQSILNCRYAPGIKKIFLYSKVLEILALQVDAFGRNLPRKQSALKTDYDKERIHFAREYLVQNIESPPGLPELARLAGINEYKLKHGFRELYNTSVFGYLAEKRLELACNYLRDSTMPIADIALSLGYSSVQHFSMAFKKKFGYPPKAAR